VLGTVCIMEHINLRGSFDKFMVMKTVPAAEENIE
jgi:hypothetical protein